MTEIQPKRNAAQLSDQGHRAEIVDRLYEVAMDPIRLEDLLEVWEGRTRGLRVGPVESAITLEDPEIEAHVSRATVFLDRLAVIEGEGGPRSVLEDIPRFAAFTSDGGPKISGCNKAAEVAFGISAGSALNALPFESPDISQLRSSLRQVAGGATDKGLTLRLRSSTTGNPVIMRITAIHNPEEKHLALALSTELVWPEGFSQTVAEAFDLTGAEIEVVQAITLGLSLKDIADARGRSVETVRTQMRSILSKSETHSQSELVRVVLALMDVAALPATLMPELPQTGLEERPFRQLTTSQGRRLEWIEFGDPGGRPVLYMHLDYGLIRWPAMAEKAAAVLGLRVIVPVRAGYGNSSPMPKGADQSRSGADDYAAVLDHLGITRATVLCLGADLRYAIILANRRPDLVTGILGCAAQLPLRTAAQYERMDKWQRFILANARYAPRILPFLVQAGFSLARRLGKEAFFTQVNGGSAADMETFARSDVRQAMLTGSDVCMTPRFSAHAAFAQECIGSEGDWSAEVAACRVPVHLMQGDQDPQTPKQTILELMVDYPHLQIEFLPDCGQLLFFKEWPLALDRLRQLLPEQA